MTSRSVYDYFPPEPPPRQQPRRRLSGCSVRTEWKTFKEIFPISVAKKTVHCLKKPANQVPHLLTAMPLTTDGFPIDGACGDMPVHGYFALMMAELEYQGLEKRPGEKWDNAKINAAIRNLFGEALQHYPAKPD